MGLFEMQLETTFFETSNLVIALRTMLRDVKYNMAPYL